MSQLQEEYKGAFVANEFIQSASGALWKRVSPMDDRRLILEWHEDPSLLDPAIQAAKSAFHDWSSLSLADRANLLLGFESAFAKRLSRFEEAIIEETGKARWEARTEAQSLVSKVKITIESMLPIIQQMEERFSDEFQTLKFKARGLCLVLGPFNFPMHLANGHIVPGLLAGNCILFKPSEFATACASLYAEAVQDVGLPSGVFQMIPGGPETGAALVEDPRIDAVFFTGSYEVGTKITDSLRRTRNDLSTLCALEMGGKNALIVEPSAHLEQAVADSILSAYATAGQRCSCASRIFVHKSLESAFVETFVEKAKRLPVGDPHQEDTFMGPLIHQTAAEKFLNHLKRAKEESFEVLLESEPITPHSSLVSPSLYRSRDPSVDVRKSSLQQEFFGPNAILIPYSTREQLIEWHESCHFALVSSLYAEDKSAFQELENRLQLGLFNWNKPTVGASSKLPFGGLKKSGNNWPAALFSYFYCSYPQAQLRGEAQFQVASLPQSLQRLWEKA